MPADKTNQSLHFSFPEFILSPLSMSSGWLVFLAAVPRFSLDLLVRCKPHSHSCPICAAALLLCTAPRPRAATLTLCAALMRLCLALAAVGAALPGRRPRSTPISVSSMHC